MRIATWNINGMRSRMEFLMHWLRERKPDVVGLQELKMDEDKFPHLELRAEGYHALVHGQKAWNGVAVLSREPGEVVQAGLPGTEDYGARLLTARVMGLEFTTIYVPNGKSVSHEDFPLKLAWLDRLIEHLQAKADPTGSAILCGDFNLCPTALDTWNEDGYAGRIFHTEEERTRFGRLIELGLIDLYRHVHPEGRSFSWWDYRAGAFHRNQGLRIDFLLGTQAVVERVKRAETDRDYRKKKDGMIASDHAPVLVELA